jgi:hypothetical protein
MIAFWMAYATIVSAAVAIAAVGLDRANRIRGNPARMVWVAALAAGLGTCGWSLRHATGSATAPDTTFVDAGPAEQGSAVTTNESDDRAPAVEPTAEPTVEPRIAPIVPLLASLRVPQLSVPRDWPLQTLDRVMLGLWAIVSLGWLGSLAVAGVTLRRRAGQWPDDVVRGVPVLVAPDFGPGVIGALRAQIVLPRWALTLGADRQALVLAHESEHVRAGDSLLILASAIAVGIAPWNPVLWYMRMRLRAALEADCDARVLAQYPDVEAYGALLINVGERAPSDGQLVAGLSEAAVALQKRIQLMTLPGSRFAGVRAGACVAVALLAIAAACATPRPGAPDAAAATIAVMPAVDSSTLTVGALQDTIRAQSARIHELEAQLQARDTAGAARLALRAELDSTRAALNTALRSEVRVIVRDSAGHVRDSTFRMGRRWSKAFDSMPALRALAHDTAEIRRWAARAAERARRVVVVDSEDMPGLIELHMRDLSPLMRRGVGRDHSDSLITRRRAEADHVALDAELRATRLEIAAMQREMAAERDAMARTRREIQAERDSTRAELKAELKAALSAAHAAQPAH